MTEGVRFLYDVLPALGSKPNKAPLPSYAQAVSQQANETPPVSLAQNPVEQSPAGKALVQGAVQDAHAAERPTVTAINDADDFLPFNFAVEPAIKSSPVAEAAARNQQHTASTSGSDELPWATDITLTSPLLRLHHEIVTFCRVLEPTREEAAIRSAAVTRVTEVVQAIWPSAEVKLFGSFLTGLYLPTSDIDLVVVNSGCSDIIQGLKAIATGLLRKTMVTNVQVISKAKVPIVKFLESHSGINFDMSFDVANGPQAAEYIRTLLDDLTPMKPLVIVLKIFLQQREMNEVYQGGIGSYALLVMVAGFLMTHPSRFKLAKPQRSSNAMELNLGQLLMDFFKLFGEDLDHQEVGISCRNGGRFYNKSAHGFMQLGRPEMLSIEDPNDEDNDLGKGSFNFPRCRTAFLLAFKRLSTPCGPNESRLERIVRLDEVLRHRSKLVDARTPASSIRPAKLALGSKHVPDTAPIIPGVSNRPAAPAAANVAPSTFAALQQQEAGTSPSPPPPPPSVSPASINGRKKAKGARATPSPPSTAPTPAAVNGRMKGVGASGRAHVDEARDKARSKKLHGRGRERDGSSEPERHSSHRHARSHDSTHRLNKEADRSKRHKKEQQTKRRHRERSASPPSRLGARGPSMHRSPMTSPSSKSGPGSLNAVVARMGKSPASQSKRGQHGSASSHGRHQGSRRTPDRSKHKHFSG
ncbi:hypothetical protein WJX74_001011 [Apatococcus lobatus]|uniref:polynucleotide adenylyltransferase n=1 Tax=Apatococcus lobatus TaxID=904363 RepID=A0AAW1QLH7_9CHLO